MFLGGWAFQNRSNINAKTHSESDRARSEKKHDFWTILASKKAPQITKNPFQSVLGTRTGKLKLAMGKLDWQKHVKKFQSFL